MIELRRLKTGEFSIDDSIPLYDYLNLPYEEILNRVMSIEEYYKEAKKVILSKEEYTKFLNGVKLELHTQEKIVRVYAENLYRGLGIVENNELKRYIIE